MTRDCELLVTPLVGRGLQVGRMPLPHRPIDVSAEPERAVLMGDPVPSSRGSEGEGGSCARWAAQRLELGFPGPCSREPRQGNILGGGWCQVNGGAGQTPRCQASASPLDIWTTAHSGLFAQCLAFVQLFNSLHWLEENTGRRPRWHLWAATR